jgi:hypothetical protein
MDIRAAEIAAGIPAGKLLLLDARHMLAGRAVVVKATAPIHGQGAIVVEFPRGCG